MAHHLVDRHGAPTRVILRRKPRHSKRYVLPYGEILQGLHNCPALKRVIRFETLSQSAKALFPPA
jgi:hypothetical protein